MKICLVMPVVKAIICPFSQDFNLKIVKFRVLKKIYLWPFRKADSDLNFGYTAQKRVFGIPQKSNTGPSCLVIIFLSATSDNKMADLVLNDPVTKDRRRRNLAAMECMHLLLTIFNQSYSSNIDISETQGQIRLKSKPAFLNL